MGINSGKLTERTFRDRWSETNENRDERKRFEEVARQLGVDLAPTPELPALPSLPTNIKALEDEIMQTRGFAAGSPRLYEVRAILKDGHPNVIEKVRQGVVKIQVQR